MGEGPGRERWARIAAWFLAVCYGLGAPLAAIAEVRHQVLSQRFDLPPRVAYATCALLFTALQLWLAWVRWPSRRVAA